MIYRVMGAVCVVMAGLSAAFTARLEGSLFWMWVGVTFFFAAAAALWYAVPLRNRRSGDRPG